MHAPRGPGFQENADCFSLSISTATPPLSPLSPLTLRDFYYRRFSSSPSSFPILFFSASIPLSFSLSLRRRYLIDTVSLVLSSPGTPAYLSAYKDGSLERCMNCTVENGNLVEYIYIYIYGTLRNFENAWEEILDAWLKRLDDRGREIMSKCKVINK